MKIAIEIIVASAIGLFALWQIIRPAFKAPLTKSTDPCASCKYEVDLECPCSRAYANKEVGNYKSKLDSNEAN